MKGTSKDDGEERPENCYTFTVSESGGCGGDDVLVGGEVGER
jgi:hypothetical protein